MECPRAGNTRSGRTQVLDVGDMHTTGGGPPLVAFGRCNEGLQAT